MDAVERSNRTWLCTVVFLDMVGYSQTPVSQQIAMKQQLNTFIAHAIENVSPNDRLMLDTGDGAALCFLGDPEDALFAALSMRNALLDHPPTQMVPLLVRIGINLGPAKLVKDLNGQLNIIGDGINVAQRVMNFAEPNQILVSRSFYEVISCLSQEYAQLFHYRGLRTDKHIREHAVYEVMVSPRQGATADHPRQAEPDVVDNEVVALAQTPVRWDPIVLQRVQTHLAYHVGPMAKLLVAQAAKQTTDLEALCEMLAAHIAEARERAVFLSHVVPSGLSGAPQGTAPPKATPATPAVSGEAERLQRLEDHLGRYLGPVARLLVQREGKKAQDFEHLCHLLATHITIEWERRSFLRDVMAH
jgi:class 3 adenylate cyclase